MQVDWWIAVAGLIVGTTVGLTGMGGGALMTPILVLLFKVNPATAVSSDVVASLVMKPIGGGVHLRKGTVHRSMVGWLCVGSIPSAFAGVLLLRALGGDRVAERMKLILGIVLLVAALAMVAKARLVRRTDTVPVDDVRDVPVKVLPTVLIGVLGGLVVGMTSVGSGSLMIVLLLFLYPRLRAGQMVGTDLVQAVPLVASATLGHLLFGEVQLALTGSLLIGAVPGVYLGARTSARAPDKVLRTALIIVLSLSALKLLGLPNGALLGALVAGLLATGGVYLAGRRSASVTPAEPPGGGSGVAEVQRGGAEVLEEPVLQLPGKPG
ncbi:MAG: sulfite exporter TauE/SafE family protein [Actinobacteria bacterium]|nr:sulfite exporter TauE/SafE family protein [Actinomycetota bacterium]